MSSSANPIRGAIPVSVASRDSSSITAYETLVTRSGPSSPVASSLILRSASATRSSPVSRRRTDAIATGVPSVSVPVIASSAAISSGGPRMESMSAWVTDSKLLTWSRNMTRAEGATTGSVGARSSPTPGSLTMSSMRDAICDRPSGVSASPRKSSVETLTSPASPKRSLISVRASATALSLGRAADSSGGGRRRLVPAPRKMVIAKRTARVKYGRAVTSLLSQPIVLFMPYPASRIRRCCCPAGPLLPSLV